jgi:hypothetical protein
MRTLIFILLILETFYGQSQDKNLNGKYTHSFFMYEYYLTLSNSGKFNIEEHTDLGTTITVGTWINDEKTITLIPTRSFKYDRSKEIHRIPSELLEKSILLIDRERNLTLTYPKSNSKDKERMYLLKKIANK